MEKTLNKKTKKSNSNKSNKNNTEKNTAKQKKANTILKKAHSKMTTIKLQFKLKLKI